MQNDTFIFSESREDRVARLKGRVAASWFCQIDGKTKELLLYMELTEPDGAPQIVARYSVESVMLLLGVLGEQATAFYNWLMSRMEAEEK